MTETVAGSQLDDWRAAVESESGRLGCFNEPADFQANLEIFAASAPPLPDGKAPAGDVAAGPDPLEADLSITARLLRAGQLSSEELTRVALDRLEVLNVKTNAVEHLDHEDALRQARAADAILAGKASSKDEIGDGPLLGVPLAHKSLVFDGRRVAACGASLGALLGPQRRSTALDRLQAAGSLSIASLQMTEIAFDPSGANPQLGDCRNPWSLEHLPGGSSSGSGVAVAARAVFGALGSDTGGSIRIPAALCGVTGLKPTYGRVSRHGAMPLSYSHDHLGPLARSAEDCGLLLAAMSGEDRLDPTTARRSASGWTGRKLDSLRGIRIGVLGGFFRDGLDPAVETAVDASLTALREAGAEIVEVPVFDFETVNALAAMMVRVEAGAAQQQGLQRYPERYSPALAARLREAEQVPAALYEGARRLRGAILRRFLETIMFQVHALHAPVLRIATPRLAEAQPGHPGVKRVGRELTRLTRPINFLGLPALSLPCGLVSTAEGLALPTGFQLIGHPFDERSLIEIGAVYQSVTDWHRLRPDWETASLKRPEQEVAQP